MTDFDGHVALITGGASGIGRATVGLLVERGARVVIADLDEVGAHHVAEEYPSNSLAIGLDVTDPDEVTAAVDSAVGHFGRLDVLVNSAGIVSKYRFLELPVEAWREMLEVHLTGSFLCGQIAAKAMAVSGGGAIVNVGSLAAELGNPLAVHYASAKGGIRMLTRSTAVALARHGIRVNAVGPGTTQTPFTADRLEDPDVRAATLERVPLGRLAEASDVAECIAFLASNRAAYVTGQTIYVDGGWSAQLYTVGYEDLQSDRLPGDSPP